MACNDSNGEQDNTDAILGSDEYVPVSNISDDLETFRQQWRSEVAERHSKVEDNVAESVEQLVVHSKSKRARKLFQQGIENERDGKMHSAIQFYRMAVQLDPEVEQHMSDADNLEIEAVPSVDEHVADENNSIDLLSRFNGLSVTHYNEKPHASNEVVTQSVNITQLPSEILCWIFRWVASSDMDMRSLEALSETCRKFYIHARDQAIWRSACEKVWGAHIKKKPYFCWRRMFIEHPHVNLDGVYISKISYFRQGDPTVFSIYYKPFQCVEYYRYIRFFGNGKMILFTSPEEPSVIVPMLKLENAKQLRFRVGHYKSHSDQQKKFTSATITAVLVDVKGDKVSSKAHRRASRNEKRYIFTESEYFLELELTATSTKKRCNKLSWLNYSSRYKFGDTGHSTMTEFSLHEQYPPFYFSRVMSYADNSLAPL